MCTVSMIGDEFSKRFDPIDWGKLNPYVPNPNPTLTYSYPAATAAEVSLLRQQVEDLKKEVLLMKDLLKAAKLYDEKNNEPNCEMENKVKKLKEIAKLMGVDLSEIFKDPS
jgi:hypothetical protein